MNKSNDTPIYHTASGTVIDPGPGTIPLTIDDSPKVKAILAVAQQMERERDEARHAARWAMHRKHKAQEAHLALVQRWTALQTALRSLYYAGHWTCDRDVDAVRLWEEVRDAAGFTHGEAPRPANG